MRRRESMAFVCGRMTSAGREAFEQLARQLPAWLDLSIIGYAPDGDTGREPVVVDGRTYDHRVYDVHDLMRWAYPGKTSGAPGDFRLMPGNTDLLQLRFAHERRGYRRYWSVEDDVRLGGHWGELLEHLRDDRSALVGTTLRRHSDDPEWYHWRSVSAPAGAPRVAETELIRGFFPFVGITRRGIRAVEQGYRAGWAGHYEALWPMLVHRAGMPIRDIGGRGEFVRPGDEDRFYTNSGRRELNPGTFVYRPYHGDYDRSDGRLHHPIRDGEAGFGDVQPVR